MMTVFSRCSRIQHSGVPRTDFGNSIRTSESSVLMICWRYRSRFIQVAELVFVRHNRRLSTQPGELSHEACDRMLREGERTLAFDTGSVASVDVCRLPSNEPCEDHYAVSTSSDGLFVGVFDGHNGPACAMAASSHLYDYMLTALSTQASKGVPPSIENAAGLPKPLATSCPDRTATQAAFLAEVQRFSAHLGSTYCEDIGTDTKMWTVRDAIRHAFVRFDNSLSSLATEGSANEEATSSILPRDLAISGVTAGSCACVTYVQGRDLFLANIGDSSAVLGVKHADGAWAARRLTREHTFDNSDEVARIRSEHPMSEYASVLKGGRLLGELMPLRAFGDVRYKWPVSDLERHLHPHLSREQATSPQHSETPPYLTAMPEVFYHRLADSDQFLVLASDGLWEFFEPDKVVRVISDHMQGKSTAGPYGRPDGAFFDEVLDALEVRSRGAARQVVDVNSGTHLMRHTLGGSGSREEMFQRLSFYLSLPPDVVRAYRDDITIIVLFFRH